MSEVKMVDSAAQPLVQTQSSIRPDTYPTLCIPTTKPRSLFSSTVSETPTSVRF